MSIFVGAASSSCGSASFSIARGSVLAGWMMHELNTRTQVLEIEDGER